ncbi:beta-lactamase-like protein [Suillus ampliporus]|nr:beta-lactamase-like protein [Suillus ampliporus]
MSSNVVNGSLSDTPQTPAIELLFLGTGTSSSIPHLDCLTAPPNRNPCLTERPVVIDVGKNFQAAAVEWFPKYGLREIDAVIITHAHADAMNGLDDLRGWTLGGAIQTHIDVYVSQSTFGEVQRSFPYLVSKEFASGGGDVPEFEWHIIEDKVPFEIKDTGVRITPLLVHHGRLFATNPPPAFAPTPYGTQPTTPNLSGRSSPARPLSDTCRNAAPKIHPYLCFGFLIQDTIVYISDVSLIPDDTWALLESTKKPMPVLVLDCLRLRAHTSHMGVGETVATVRRLNPKRTYMTGFSHDISHDEYITIGKAAGGNVPKDTTSMSDMERRGVEMIREGKPVWIRPSHDGLRVFVSSDDSVKDETYD